MTTRRLSRLLLVLLVSACNDAAAPRVPARIAILSGGSQSGAVAEALPLPVVIVVSDDGGRPVGGAAVSWAAVDGSVTQATALTDAEGRAQATWSLGERAGDNRLVVNAGALELAVSATGVAGAPAALVVQGGLAQSGIVGQPVELPLAVRVADRYDNPVAGVAVTFEPGSGSGTVTGAATTNPAGVAEVVWTLGARPGEQVVEARVGGIPGSVRFTAVAVMGPPAVMVALSPDTLSGVVNQEVTLRVRLEDAAGNPLPQATVAFAASGWGIITPDPVVTGDDGQAQVTWRLGRAAGLQTATATAGSAALQFVATARPGPMARIQYMGDTVQAGTVGQVIATPIVMRAVDVYGNPIAGAELRFMAEEGGAADPAVATTDSAGMARTTWTLGGRAGPQRMAVVSSVPSVFARFDATALAGPAAIIALTPQAPVLSALGGTVQLNAAVRDAHGNEHPPGIVSWSSSAPAVATVTSFGEVRAVGSGSAVITGTAGTVSAAVTVEVAPSQALDVSVSGLPADASAAITVVGAGWEGQLAGSGTLNVPAAGTYTVAAAPVASGGITWWPAPAAQAVAVASGTTASVSFAYTSGVTALGSGVPVSGLSGAAESMTHFRITVPVGAASLNVVVGGAAGVDLYVRHRAEATPQLWNCRSSTPGTDEICSIPSPAAGDWYILLHGHEDWSGATLLASYPATSTGVLSLDMTGLPDGAEAAVTVTGAGYTGSFGSAQSVPLAEGAYTVTAATITHTGLEYTPALASQDVTVAAGLTTHVQVAYTGGVRLLTSDVAAKELSGAVGSEQHFRIAVPAGASILLVLVNGGLGNPDLYVRRGTRASEQVHDCSSTTTTNSPPSDSCWIASPVAGDWYIMLRGRGSYSGVTLTATASMSIPPGSIDLSVTGLPAGTVAAISVRGPDGFRATATGSRTLATLPTGRYVIDAPPVSSGGTIYTASPPSQATDVTHGVTRPVAVVYAPATQTNLTISGMHVTQAVQTLAGDVPLVAGRDGLLRVFGTGTGTSATPPVRVRIYHNGALVETRTVTRNAAVPGVLDEGALASSWNLPLQGSLIQPGLAIVADIDPDNGVVESDESDNAYPAGGASQGFDVRPAAPFRARFVSIHQTAFDLTGDVTAANVASYVTDAAAMYPFAEIDVDVRASVFSTATYVVPEGGARWNFLLSYMDALRIADGSDRFYYGVVRAPYTSGVFGVGYRPGRAAVGVDFPSMRAHVTAHEWGHNLDRRHVNCGEPGQLEPDYPHTGGRTGAVGWDARTGELASGLSTYDLMSYCAPAWVSDFTYRAVMDYRAAQPAPAAKQPSLLVWGRIDGDGKLELEPAFEIMAAPEMPAAAGRYTLEALDEGGASLLRLSFDGTELDHEAGRHFAFAVPLAHLGARPAVLRLSDGTGATVRSSSLDVAGGPGGEPQVAAAAAGAGQTRLRWDAERTPMVMVRDPRTGDVLAFARGGDVVIATGAAELDLVMSDGVRSTTRRLVVPR